MIGVGIGLVIFFVAIFFTVRPFCQMKYRFIVFGVGMVLTLGSTLAFARDLVTVVSGIMLYAGLAYGAIIFQMLWEYCAYVSKHLTHKENRIRR